MGSELPSDWGNPGDLERVLEERVGARFEEKERPRA